MSDCFSIGEALDAYDAATRAQRETECDEPVEDTTLADYASLLTATAHPPEECGDPYDCPTHGEAYRAYMDRSNDLG